MQCCTRVQPGAPAPRFATVHIEYQSESESDGSETTAAGSSDTVAKCSVSNGPKLVHQVHVNVWHKMLRQGGHREPAASLMRAVLQRANVPKSKLPSLFAALRTAYWLTDDHERRCAAQIRLLAAAAFALLDAQTCFAKFVTPALHADLQELFTMECADTDIAAVRCSAIRLVSAFVLVSPSSRHA